jgi:hypothetical protein
MIEPVSDRRLVQTTGGVVIAAGVALGIVRFFGEVPPGQNLEAAAGATAFGALIAASGILALLSLRHRPALLLPAAVLLVPLSFLSFALVTLPLLIPAALLFRTFARAAEPRSGWRVPRTPSSCSRSSWGPSSRSSLTTTRASSGPTRRGTGRVM